MIYNPSTSNLKFEIKTRLKAILFLSSFLTLFSIPISAQVSIEKNHLAKELKNKNLKLQPTLNLTLSAHKFNLGLFDTCRQLSNWVGSFFTTTENETSPQAMSMMTCGGVVGGTAPGDDLDGDGYCNDVDYDDDNDGILDSDEGKCDQPTVANSNTGTGIYQDQLYFFNWDGTDFNDGLQTGDSQTFNLPDGLTITATFTNVTLTGTGAEITTADFQTWGGAYLKNLYNTPGNEETFYGNSSTQDMAVTVVFSATKNGLQFPLDLVSLDSESTNENTAEDWAVTTNGSNWQLLEQYSNGGVWTGAGTSTVTATNTEQSGGNSIFYSEGVTELNYNITSNGTQQQAFAIGIYLICDSDNDGIPNTVDTDSDNDGCPDAIEGGGTFTNTDIQNDALTGSVDANGMPVVATASGQTIGDSQDAATQDPDCSTYCTEGDNDNDGICDIDDLDDDNDGILDSDECGNSVLINKDFEDNVNPALATNTYGSAPTRAFIFNETDVDGWDTDATDNRIEIWESGHTGVTSYSGSHHAEINAFQNAELFQEINFTTNGEISWSIAHQGRFGIDSTSISIGIVGSQIEVARIGTDSTGWEVYSGTFMVSTPGTYRFSFNAISTGSGDVSVGNFIDLFEVGFCPDTDGDGIADYLDTDSDNDGCPDALEGGGTFTNNDIANDTLTGGVDADGIPIVATASGQTTGTSQDASVQSCPCPYASGIDTDSDGVDDFCDLDADNDGILDLNECSGNVHPVLGELFIFNATTPVVNSSTGATPNALYPNVGTYLGQSFDLLITINSFDPAEVISFVSYSTGPGFNQTTGVGNQEYSNVTLEFFEAGTSTPLAVSGKILVLDLDETGGVITNNADFYDVELYPATWLTVVDDGTQTTVEGTQTGTAISEQAVFYYVQNKSIIEYQIKDEFTNSGYTFQTTQAHLQGWSCMYDSDGDGIPDNIDLDSDNDGCPDAIEGSGSFTNNDIQNDTLTGGVDADGIPLVAAPGQTTGTSQDATILAEACITVAENDINQTPQDVPVDGNILTNDSDPSGDTQTVQSATGLDAAGNPINIPIDGTPTPIYDENGVLAGTIAMNPDGYYTFDPAPGYTGSVPVEYVVVDSTDATDTATLDIDVIPTDDPTQNDPPVANDDTNTTEMDVNVGGNVIDPNDSDPDGDPLTVTSILADTDGDGIVDDPMPVGTPTPIYGTDCNGNTVLAGEMTLNANGTYTFDPEPTFKGEVPVDYTIEDPSGLSDDATLTITIEPDNGNATYANDDSNVGPQAAPQAGNVITNDNDPEGNPQMITGGTTADGTPVVPGTPVTLPSGGTLTLNADGSYDYIPDPNFVGTEVVEYEVCDDQTPAACETATLYLTTLPNNTTIAEDDINQTPQDVPVDGNILTNDTDDEGDAQTVQSATGLDAAGNPINIPVDGTPTPIYDENGVLAGTIALMPDGSYTYDPAPGYTGSVPVEYVVVDANGATDTATLDIDVIPANDPAVNQPPVANDDTNTTEMDVNVGGNVIDPNDSDPDGDPLTVTSILADTDGDGIVDDPMPVGTPTPIYGTDCNGNTVLAGEMTLNANGTYSFDPEPTFKGEVPLDYTIEDPSGLSDDATLTITIEPDYGNATYANDDANTGPQAAPQSGNVVDNDNDPEGNPQMITGGTTADGTPIVPGTPVTLPSGGTLTLNADGSYDYIPDPNFVGTEVVEYEVCDDQTPAACETATLYLTTLPNNTTIAEDDINQTPQDVPVDGNILTNDTDDEGDAQTVQSATGLDAAGNPINIPIDGTPTAIYDENGVLAGTIALMPDGSYTYDPAPGYTGSVPVEYVVVDSTGATDTATLDIDVIPTDDPTQNDPPVANDDTNTTEMDVNVDGNVIDPNDTDPDGDPLTVTSILADTDGDGIVDDPMPVGTPTPIYGTDCNGNTVLAGEMMLNTNGTYTFDPEPTFKGEVPVDYTIEDPSGLSDDATLTITIEPDNGNATYANDDSNVGPQGDTQTGNVITNDNDPEGNPQMITGGTTADGTPIVPGTPVTLPSGGTLTLNPDGSYDYIPDPNFVGTEVVEYEVCDDQNPAACEIATLYLTTLPVNTIEATDDFSNTPFDTPLVSNVSTNDLDPEGDNVTFALDTPMPASEGTVTMNPDGSYTFTPAPGFSGETSFTYEVCDDGTPMMCTIATAYIEVLPPVDPENPIVIANPDANTVEEGQTATGDIMANDLDPDVINPMVTNPPTNTPVSGVDEDGNPVANAGTLTINPDGTYTFIPEPGFTGKVTQPYTICGASTPVACDNSELIICVIPDEGNTTFANDDAMLTDAGVSQSDDLLTNDTDGEGDPQTVCGFEIDTDGDGVADVTGTIGTPITVGGMNDMGVFTANAGSLIINTDGTYTFDPTIGFVGNVSLPYSTCDDGSAIDDATLDITVVDVQRDYGDAPANYPIAYHRAMTDSDGDNVLDGATDVWLGTGTDFETSQQFSGSATGDSNDDAISFGPNPGQFPLSATPGATFNLDITVNSSGPDMVFFGLWIDWDNDGIFEEFHQGSQATSSPATTTVIITTPTTAGTTPVNVRLRADDDLLLEPDFEGGKTNGEVEDYQALVVLPIELTSFEGMANDCDVELKWTAESEKDFSHFEIERSESENDFKLIEAMNPIESDNFEKHYTFFDKNAKTRNYYRLKMVDLDGSFEYSNVIIVETDCTEEQSALKLFPNPIGLDQTTLNVEFRSRIERVSLISVVDQLGAFRLKFPIEVVEGNNNLNVDISNLPSGIYTLQIESETGKILSKQFAKIRQ